MGVIRAATRYVHAPHCASDGAFAVASRGMIAPTCVTPSKVPLEIPQIVSDKAMRPAMEVRTLRDDGKLVGKPRLHVFGIALKVQVPKYEQHTREFIMTIPNSEARYTPCLGTLDPWGRCL